MAELIAAFGIDWRLILAQSINFLIVLVGLTYFLYRPVMEMIAKRQAAIEQGIRDAEEAAALKTSLDASRDEVLREANQNAEAVLARAEEQAKRERAEIVKAAQARAEAMQKDAEMQGAALRASVLKEAEKEIARAAILATEKLVREKTS